MAVDFGILQKPDFAAALQGGFATGQALGKQRALDEALRGVDLSRPETILGVLRHDPQTGAALLSSANKMAEARREAQGTQALSDLLLARSGARPSGSAAPSGSPSLMAPSIAGEAMDAQPGDIVVQGRQADPVQSAEQSLMRLDPKTYLEVQRNIGAMDEAKRKATEETMDALGSALVTIADLPPEQRRARLDQLRPMLVARGVAEDQIDSADLSDAGIDLMAGQALGVKEILADRGRRRDDARADRSLEATISHQNATESVAAGNLAINRGRLGLAQKAEARSAKGGSGVEAMSTADLLTIAGGN